MVRHSFPQRFTGNINTNTNYPTQGEVIGGDIPEDWFDTDWKRRVRITINGGQITNTHTDYPLLFNSKFTGIENGNALADGGDIRFVLEDKTVLKSEIQFIDVSAENGALIAWTKVPSLQTGTSFFMYYDNPAATLPVDPENVWTNYGTVYHLSETTPPATNLKDSTTNSSATTSSTSPTTTTGKIGNGVNFVPSENVQIDSVAGADGWLSLWVNPDATGGPQYISSYLSNKWSVLIGFQMGNFNFFPYPTGTATDSEFSATSGVWQKIDIVVNGQFADTNIFKNGVEITNSPFTDGNDRSGSSTLALSSATIGAVNPYDGQMDEFRLKNTIPANIADRILGEYNNQNSINDPNVFYAITDFKIIP